MDRKPRRKSIRLKYYDYSQAGGYFVTICVQKTRWLSEPMGEIIRQVWYDLPNHYSNVELDEFVVMPNHIHGIIMLSDVGAGFKPAPTMSQQRYSLPEVVRGFKTFASRKINEYYKTVGQKFWQRNYYEHVIRNENELNRIREYIINNLLKWQFDWENPERTPNPQYENEWKWLEGK